MNDMNVVVINKEEVCAEAMECLQYYVSVTKVDKLPYPMNEQLQNEAFKLFVEWNIKIL